MFNKIISKSTENGGVANNEHTESKHNLTKRPLPIHPCLFRPAQKSTRNTAVWMQQLCHTLTRIARIAASFCLRLLSWLVRGHANFQFSWYHSAIFHILPCHIVSYHMQWSNSPMQVCRLLLVICASMHMAIIWGLSKIPFPGQPSIAQPIA